MDEPTIATRLRELRTARDLTQAQLADLIGVSRQTINYMEKGDYTPSVKLALLLARVLEVAVEDIFTLQDSNR